MYVRCILSFYTQAFQKKGGRRGSSTFLNLKYIHDQNTPLEKFEEIADFCQSLSALFLDTPQHHVLDKVANFSSIQKLKFNKIEFNSLLGLLADTNKRLTCLDLVSCTGSLDLGKLSRFCPNLVSLEIYYSKNVVAKGQVFFPCLRKVVIYSTEVSGDAANDLLENSPNLQHVTLNSASTLDFNRLVQIVNKGLLNNVEEFALMSAPLLDLNSLELLIDRLPKLNIVGRLEGWKVTAHQLENLRDRVKKQNFDLTLWYNLPLHVELAMEPDILDF